MEVLLQDSHWCTLFNCASLWEYLCIKFMIFGISISLCTNCKNKKNVDSKLCHCEGKPFGHNTVARAGIFSTQVLSYSIRSPSTVRIPNRSPFFLLDYLCQFTMTTAFSSPVCLVQDRT